jgi:hypothetical protein
MAHACLKRLTYTQQETRNGDLFDCVGITFDFFSQPPSTRIASKRKRRTAKRSQTFTQRSCAAHRFAVTRAWVTACKGCQAR